MASELENWRSLVDALPDADEAKCEALIKEERDNQNRPTFINRIYGRYNVLRSERERRELTGASRE